MKQEDIDKIITHITTEHPYLAPVKFELNEETDNLEVDLVWIPDRLAIWLFQEGYTFVIFGSSSGNTLTFISKQQRL